MDFLTFTTETGARSESLPVDLFIIITDTLQSPAPFLITHFISRSLRENRKTLLVGLKDSLDQYTAVLKKTGIQLTTEINKQRFKYLDGTEICMNCPGEGDGLKELYKAIESSVEEEGMLILIDDISSLVWCGFEPERVADFMMAVKALSTRQSASLVVLQHGDNLIAAGVEGAEDSYLFRRVLQQCDLWLEVTSLSSQTRGELSIHRGPALVKDLGILERSGPTALQYKLEEAGAVFSQKGLSKGFF